MSPPRTPACPPTTPLPIQHTGGGVQERLAHGHGDGPGQQQAARQAPGPGGGAGARVPGPRQVGWRGGEGRGRRLGRRLLENSCVLGMWPATPSTELLPPTKLCIRSRGACLCVQGEGRGREDAHAAGRRALAARCSPRLLGSAQGLWTGLVLACTIRKDGLEGSTAENTMLRMSRLVTWFPLPVIGIHIPSPAAPFTTGADLAGRPVFHAAEQLRHAGARQSAEASKERGHDSPAALCPRIQSGWAGE